MHRPIFDARAPPQDKLFGPRLTKSSWTEVQLICAIVPFESLGDIAITPRDVRFTPKADIRPAGCHVATPVIASAPFYAAQTAWCLW